MATKTGKKTTPNRAKELKKTVKKINKKAVKFSDNLVEETLAAGEEWQVVFAKAVKNGTILLGKQQDLVFDTLEDVKAHVLKGNARFRKLFALDYAERKLEEIKAKQSKKVAKTVADAKNRVEKIADRFEDFTEEVYESGKSAVEKSIVEKTTPKSAKKKAGVKKTAKITRTVKARVAKTPAKSSVKKSNLKLIEGIGPKIESLLNEAGIVSFEQLATAKPEAVKAVLLNAGARYKMHNPTTWMKQAALAAAGKMTELKTLQAELKGGKKV